MCLNFVEYFLRTGAILWGHCDGTQKLPMLSSPLYIILLYISVLYEYFVRELVRLNFVMKKKK